MLPSKKCCKIEKINKWITTKSLFNLQAKTFKYFLKRSTFTEYFMSAFIKQRLLVDS